MNWMARCTYTWQTLTMIKQKYIIQDIRRANLSAIVRGRDSPVCTYTLICSYIFSYGLETWSLRTARNPTGKTTLPRHLWWSRRTVAPTPSVSSFADLFYEELRGSSGMWRSCDRWNSGSDNPKDLHMRSTPRRFHYAVLTCLRDPLILHSVVASAVIRLLLWTCWRRVCPTIQSIIEGATVWRRRDSGFVVFISKAFNEWLWLGL